MLIEELDRDNVVSRSMYRDYQLRYCHRWEVHHMLQLCGFEIEALYGDFDLSDFDETSTEMIWVARKPGNAWVTVSGRGSSASRAPCPPPTPGRSRR